MKKQENGNSKLLQIKKMPKALERVMIGFGPLTNTIYIYKASRKNPNEALHKYDATSQVLVGAAEYLVATGKSAVIEVDGALYELDVRRLKKKPRGAKECG